jgi:hypothetical protein
MMFRYHLFIVACFSMLLTGCLQGYPRHLGEIVSIEGKVFVARAHEPIQEVSAQDRIYADDLFESQLGSRATVLLYGKGLVTLGPNTRAILDQPRGEGKAAIVLEHGTLHARVSETSSDEAPMEVRAPGAFVAEGEAEFIVWAYEAPKTADGTPHEELILSVGVANIGTHGVVHFGKAGKSLAVLPRLFSVAGADSNPTPSTPIEVKARPPTSPTSEPSLGLLTAGKALAEYGQPRRAWTDRLSGLK